MANKLKIVFMGTPDFAVESLKALISSEHEIAAVFTQPDKASGRKMKIVYSPVKQLALENGLEIYQPCSLRKGEDAEKSLELLKKINPDIVIVVAYGQILPKEVLDIPRLGCVNIHGSLLPKYRGAAPIEWSVINGEKETGVTSMFMGEGLDTGDMLIKETVKIGRNETAIELRQRLAVIGANVLLKTIEGLENNTITPEKQDDSESTYASKISKDMSKLDFSMPAEKIRNIIRGITGYTMLEGKRLKVFKAENIEYSDKFDAPVGTIIDTENFIVLCGDGNGIRFDMIQPEGKKQMEKADYLRGKKLKENTILG